MAKLQQLPLTLLLLLLTSPFLVKSKILSERNSSLNDPFRMLALNRARPPPHGICCLIKPPLTDVSEIAEEEVLVSFEEWQAKQRALNYRPKVRLKDEIRGSQRDAVKPSAHTADNSLHEASSAAKAIPGIEMDTVTTSPHFRVPITDRFNYANVDCSARVHLSHREAASSASLILSSKRDRYMLSPCFPKNQDEGRFVVVELCDDIRIDTVQLANFEFFSGVFKDIKVSVAKTYNLDSEGWTDAGHYVAQNKRGVQSFHPPTSLRDFYRYIRIDFVSHYGTEYYCPISLLRVYGLTHLEHWKWDIWEAESLEKRGSAQSSLETNDTESGISATMDGIKTAYEGTFSSDVNSYIAALETSGIALKASNPLMTHTEIHFPSVTSDESKRSTIVTLGSDATDNTPTVTSTVLISPKTALSAAITSSDVITEPSRSHDRKPSQTATVSIPVGALAPSASSGESIYRTIMNRLSAIESSHALYTAYVDAQTSGVREVLRKMGEEVGRLDGVAKNQRSEMIRTGGDWERQWRLWEAERDVLEERVRYLTDEVTLEKRIGIAQLCLLLTVLIFMGLTRGSRGESILVAGDRFKLERSVKEWGRRTLSFGSGRWKNKFGSVTPPPLRSPTKVAGDDAVIFPASEAIAEKAINQDIVSPASRSNVFSSPSKSTLSRSQHTPLSDRRSNPFRRPRTPSNANRTPLKHSPHAASGSIVGRSQPHGNLEPSVSDFIGIGAMPKSARRWARSAHLHEVSSPLSSPKAVGILNAPSEHSTSTVSGGNTGEATILISYEPSEDIDRPSLCPLDLNKHLQSNDVIASLPTKPRGKSREKPLLLHPQYPDHEEDGNWVDTDNDVGASEGELESSPRHNAVAAV